ncbi:Innexin-16 [Toxocara canis]|uniref:Innexin n=1 Tax=Toxocara canis TaxID=6265 RepID=A0A0B2VB60_TOXCA|nr:Innexin-16 [Toxocara canis]
MFLWPDEIGGRLSALRSDPTDDIVDRLNYVYTVSLLVFFAALVGAKQHFGSPIQCMAPAHFPGTWTNYAHDYCFVSNTYSLNVTKPITDGLTTGTVTKQEIVYYQWVPYVLVIQAFLLLVPKIFWNSITSFHGGDEAAFHESLIFTCPTARKDCFVRCPILAQYSHKLLNDFAVGHTWRTTGMFPRVTFCDFNIAHLAQTNVYSVQCVLMVNILNEKIFLFLWFWITALTAVDLLSAFYTTFVFITPSFRRSRILRLFQIEANERSGAEGQAFSRFMRHSLKPDSALLLWFVNSHAGGLIANELAWQIWGTVNSSQRLPRSLGKQDWIGKKTRGVSPPIDAYDGPHRHMLRSLSTDSTLTARNRIE